MISLLTPTYILQTAAIPLLLCLILSISLSSLLRLPHDIMLIHLISTASGFGDGDKGKAQGTETDYMWTLQFGLAPASVTAAAIIFLNFQDFFQCLRA